MKRVLVTGSAGFVGSHFVEHVLKNTDWKVVGLDSFRHRGDALRVQPDMDPSRYEMHFCDLAGGIGHRLRDRIGTIDFLVNFASDSHVDRSITDPVPFVRNNVDVMLNVLEYAREVRPRTFIQISTDEVYGSVPLNKPPVAEWAPILPSNPYSASKAAQEALAISYWRSYGVPLVLTNCMNIFGARQDVEKFIPKVISRVHDGSIVEIHGNQDRIGRRAYLHARNKADALLFLLKNTEARPYEASDSEFVFPDRYNIVGDREMDNLEVAKLIAKLMHKSLRYEMVDFHAARPGHDPRYSLDGSKLAALGWSAPLSFERSLETTIEWTLKHPEWLK